MRKLLGRLALAGALAGGVLAVLGYLRKAEPRMQGSVQIVFDGGATTALDANSAEGREFIEIARNILEIGV